MSLSSTVHLLQRGLPAPPLGNLLPAPLPVPQRGPQRRGQSPISTPGGFICGPEMGRCSWGTCSTHLCQYESSSTSPSMCLQEASGRPCSSPPRRGECPPSEELPMGPWLLRTRFQDSCVCSFREHGYHSRFFLPRKNGVFDEIFLKESLQERGFNSYENFSVSSTMGKILILCLVASILQGPVRSFAFSFLELLKINGLRSMSQNISPVG